MEFGRAALFPLFIISIELLSHIVSISEGLKVIRLSGVEFRKSLFADDASFILDGSVKGLTPQMKITHCLIMYTSKNRYPGHTSGNTAAFHPVI